MEDILTAIYCSAMVGWFVFMLTIVFGFAPTLYRKVLKESIEDTRMYLYLLYASYIATVVTILSVIVLNGFMMLLVFSVDERLTGNPWVWAALIIGIVQFFSIWGPIVKALFIAYILKNKGD